MANPTTYFGWVMPNSADLVTDLPADFNVFGQGVDTSMQYLLGGTTGQVLSKTSGTNMAFTWVTPTDQTPLTTKGDLFAFSTVDARLPAGANETRLVADTAQTLGLKYVADTTNYAIAAKADLLVGTAADTLAALTVGTNGQVLTADSTVSPTGLKWATPSGSSFSGARCHKASDQAITTNTYTQLTWDTEEYDTDNYHDLTTNTDRFTVPTTGYYAITITTSSSNSGTNTTRYYNIRQASTSMVFMAERTSQLEIGNTVATNWYLTAGQYVTIRVYQTSSSTQTFFGDANYGVDGACTFAINFLGA